MLRTTLTCAMVGLSVGCGDFNLTDNHYACESLDDCADGYVCADYVVETGNVTSYCVKSMDARFGVFLTWVTSDFRTTPGCDLSTTEVTVRMQAATGDGSDWEDQLKAKDSWPSAQSEWGDCVGSLTSAGVLTAFCSSSLGAGEPPPAVAIWTVAHVGSFNPSDSHNWWVHGFGGGLVDPENPLVQPYPMKVDTDERDTAACRTARRTNCGFPPTCP